MNKVFRTILVCEKRNGKHILVYGHCIEWLLTNLDYYYDKWGKKSLKNFIVCWKDFASIDEIHEFLKAGLIKIITTSEELNILFKHTKKEPLFLEKTNDAKYYNPFISYCTKVTFFYSEHTDFHGEPIMFYWDRNKDILNEIVRDFSIPFDRFPSIINSFAIFVPTRIMEYFRGYDENGKAGFKLIIVDEFKQYSDAEVVVDVISGTKNIVKQFVLSKNPVDFPVGVVPDSCKTTIKMNGDLIYLSDFYLIKQISIDMRISGRMIRVGDNIVQTFTSQKMMITGKDEKNELGGTK